MEARETSALGAAPEARNGRLAHALSYVLHPVAVGTPIGLWVGPRYFGGLTDEVLLLAGKVALLGIVFPLVVLGGLLYTGRVRDFFLTRREERQWLYTLGLVDLVLILWLFHQGGAPAPIIAAVTACFAATLALAIVNLFVKASLHCAGNAGIALSLCWIEGWHFWPIWLLVPLTVWARLECGHHNRNEVVAGLLAGTLPVSLALAAMIGPPAGRPGGF